MFGTTSELIEEAGNPVYRIIYSRQPERRLQGIQAEIWSRHLSDMDASNRTTGFVGGPDSVWYEQMVKLQAIGYPHEHNQTNQRGELVSSAFSGPTEWYNLAPMKAEINQNRRTTGNRIFVFRFFA
jgi:hypothetical protein